ncbi:proprotein_convertase subtilisin/kexin type 5-like [Hexamita inflata]|uniref:Proprotein_convertase subtilisin/kexin type 5-like n=1 Tax=Hexamita inflata TaxID=28002 RepID=A0ABP1HIV3_9EUKA
MSISIDNQLQMNKQMPLYQYELLFQDYKIDLVLIYNYIRYIIFITFCIFHFINMILFLLILNIEQQHVCPLNQLINQGICVQKCPKSRNYVYDEECHLKCPDKQIFMLQKENGIHCLNECPNKYTIKENFCISVHQHKGVILCPPKSYQLKGQCVQQSEYPNIYISSDGKFYNEKCENGEKNNYSGL